jgi:hypothetical protein
MDILVPDRGRRIASQRGSNEARIWGLVGAAVVLGLLLLIGTFERAERQQLAANDPGILRSAPALPEMNEP